MRTQMKTALLLAGIGFSTLSQAAHLPRYYDQCREAAVNKLRAIADAGHYELDEDSVRLSGTDSRWYNPWKYLWFSGEMANANGTTEAQVITQNPPFGRCF